MIQVDDQTEYALRVSWACAPDIRANDTDAPDEV